MASDIARSGVSNAMKQLDQQQHAGTSTTQRASVQQASDRGDFTARSTDQPSKFLSSNRTDRSDIHPICSGSSLHQLVQPLNAFESERRERLMRVSCRSTSLQLPEALGSVVDQPVRTYPHDSEQIRWFPTTGNLLEPSANAQTERLERTMRTSCRRSMTLPVSESLQCKEMETTTLKLTDAEDELLALLVKNSERQQLDEKKSSRVVDGDVEKPFSERHSMTSPRNSDFGGNIELTGEESEKEKGGGKVKKVLASSLCARASTVDKETFDSHLERRISQKAEVMIVDEPDWTPKITLLHETRSIQHQVRHEEVPNEEKNLKRQMDVDEVMSDSRSREAGEFAVPNVETHDDVVAADGEPDVDEYQFGRKTSPEEDEDSRSKGRGDDDNHDVEKLHSVGHSATVNDPEVTGRSDDSDPKADNLDDVGIILPVAGEQVVAVSVADFDASSLHLAISPSAVDTAAAGCDDRANIDDDVGEKMTAESDSATKVHLPPTNTRLSGQLNADEVFDENENFSPSSTSNRFNNAWAMPYKSQSSVDADGSFIVGSLQPDESSASSPNEERQRLYVNENERGQSTGDHSREFLNSEPDDGQRDWPVDIPPTSSFRGTSNEVVETSSWRAWNLDDQRAPLLVDEEKTGVETASSVCEAVEPVLIHGNKRGSWKSSESSEDSDTPYEKQSYHPLDDDGSSDGLSTEQQRSNGWSWTAVENDTDETVVSAVDRGDQCHVPADAMDKRDLVYIEVGDIEVEHVDEKTKSVTEEEILAKPSFVTEASAETKTSLGFRTDSQLPQRRLSFDKTNVIEKDSISEFAVQTEVDFDHGTVQSDDDSLCKVAAEICQLAVLKAAEQFNQQQAESPRGELDV